MSAIQTQHRFRVDLDSCPLEAELPRPLSHTDALADEIVLAVRRGMSPIDPEGMTVLGSLILSDRRTLPLSGAVSGGCVVLPLTADCYAVPGPFTLTVQLISGDVRHTLLRLKGQMARSSTEQLIPSGELLPTLPELLTQISSMQAATADALEAAAAAERAAAPLKAFASGVAPAILLDASGETAVTQSAAPHAAQAVVTTLQPLQEGSGTPSASNVRPIIAHTSVSLYHAAVRTEDAAPIASETLPDSFYAGTLDWLSGSLICTHALLTLPGTGVGWVRGSNNVYIDVTDIAENASLLSNQFVVSSNLPTNLPEGTMRQGAVHTRVCFANPGSALSSEDWRARCDAQPIQLLYELAQPIRTTLSARQLTLLAGSNALWSDAGQTRVIYVCDTKAYIDERLAAIAAGA